MKTQKIYLSSTNYDSPYIISKIDHSKWRKKFKKIFYEKNIEFIEPIFTKNPSISVVMQDKKSIENCDYLVAYIAMKTCGTSMEIMYASKILGSSCIYIIDPYSIVQDDPWIKYHSNIIFSSIEDCAQHMMKFL